jgi:hypothetical protein
MPIHCRVSRQLHEALLARAVQERRPLAQLVTLLLEDAMPGAMARARRTGKSAPRSTHQQAAE